MHALLHSDGGARGNPGPAGIGVVLRHPSGDVIAELARAIGVSTNNVAEYTALIDGLELALDKGVKTIDVHLDSQLVVSQVKGEWKIKNANLKPLAIKAHSLLRRFDAWTIVHVPREHNADADALANQAMDAAELDVELDDEGREPTQGSFLE